MGRKASITPLKAAFIEAFIKTGGNAVVAARVAGYQGNANTLRVTAQKLMDDPLILEALMRSSEADPEVWDKTALQKWWTKVVKGDLVVLYTKDGKPFLGPAPIDVRGRFSELLGKSQAAFVDVKRHEHTGKVRVIGVAIPDNGRHALAAGPEVTEKKAPLPS